MTGRTPTVARVEAVPVAGHDSMLLNLSGAHGPCSDVPRAHRAGVGAAGPADGQIAVPATPGLGARDDAVAMQYVVPGWTFDPERPCLVR